MFDLERTEKRKHIQQMNQKEILYIFDELKKIDNLDRVYHAESRAEERQVNAESFFSNVKDNLRKSKIIEFKEIKYSNGKKEHRVLIGVKNNGKIDRDFKMVISLTFKKIITIWENKCNDNHKTVDKSIYNKKLFIC